MPELLFVGVVSAIYILEFPREQSKTTPSLSPGDAQAPPQRRDQTDSTPTLTRIRHNDRWYDDALQCNLVVSPYLAMPIPALSLPVTPFSACSSLLLCSPPGLARPRSRDRPQNRQVPCRKLLPVPGNAASGLHGGLLQRRCRRELHRVPGRRCVPNHRHRLYFLQPWNLFCGPCQQLHLVPPGVLLPEHGSLGVLRLSGRNLFHGRCKLVRDLPSRLLLPPQYGGRRATVPRRHLLDRRGEQLHGM